MADYKKIQNEIKELINLKKHVELEARLLELQNAGQLIPSMMTPSLTAIAKNDDVKALKLFTEYGLTYDPKHKSRKTRQEFMKKAAGKGALNVVKFLVKQGYSTTYTHYNGEHGTPVHAAFMHSHEKTAKFLISHALEDDPNGLKAVAYAAAHTGRIEYLNELSVEQLDEFKLLDNYPFAVSIQSNKLKAARFFKKFAGNNIFSGNENGHTALTAYKTEDFKKMDKTLTYLVQDLKFDLNHKTNSNHSFLVKDDYYSYNNPPIHKYGHRFLPLYIKHGLNLAQQLTNKEPYDLLRKITDDDNYSSYNGRLFFCLTDLVYHDQNMDVEKLKDKGNIFGSYLKEYMQDKNVQINIASLLDKGERYLFNEPVIATSFVYSSLEIAEPNLVSDVKKTNTVNLKRKIKVDESYRSEKDGEIIIHTERISSHICDIVDQMMKNIVFPTAIKQYGITVKGKYHRDDNENKRKLKKQMAKALFGTHSNDYADYKMSQLDKIILLMNRYDVGVSYINAGLSKYTPAHSWEPYCNVMQAPNGKLIIPISSSTEAKTAANNLHNCFYGSLSKLNTGEIVGFNVTDDKDIYQNLPAISLDLNGNISQYSAPVGYKNKSPDTKTSDAWKWFLNELKNGKDSALRKQFLNWSNDERSKKQAEDSGAGFDITADNWKERHQAVFEGWQRVFGGTDRYRYRHVQDVDTFLHVTGMHKLMADMSPKREFSQQRELMLGGGDYRGLAQPNRSMSPAF